MNLLEEKNKGEYDVPIKNILKKLQFKKDQFYLNGSAVFKILKYKSDYDIYTTITYENDNPEKFYFEFNNIFQKIKNIPNLYFLKAVLFNEPEKKYKWYPDDEFKKKDFVDNFIGAKFFKCDFVLYHDKKFYSLDVIYYLPSYKPQTEDEIITTLKEDIVEYKKENRFYKILKRLFKIELLKTNKDTEILKKYIDFFNSETGRLYEEYNILDSINELNEYEFYKKNDALQKQVKASLKELKIKDSEIKNMPSYIEKLSNIINNNSKEFIKTNKISI